MEDYRAPKYKNEFKNYKNRNWDKSLKIKEISKGYVLPLKNSRGGVLNEKKDFVPLSFHNGEWFKFGGKYTINSTVPFVDKTVIYLGVFIHQWGHFLLDSLSRCWIANKMENIKRANFIYISENKSSQIDGNYEELLSLLDISKDQVTIVRQPTQFKKIIVPEMCTDQYHNFTKDYDQIFNKIIYNADISNIKVPSRIYLTRTGLNEANKKEFCEKSIEDNFKLNDFTVLKPEKLSLLNQIAIFQKATIVACLNGSIPFNMLFASNKPKFIIINKTSIPHINIREIAAVHNIHPIFLNGFVEPFKNIPQTLGEGPFLLDFSPELRSYFDTKGWKYTKEKNTPSKYIILKYIFQTIKVKIKNLIKSIINKRS